MRRRTHTGACRISVDSDGRISSWTKDAEVVFGYTSEHAVGLSVDRLLPFFGDFTSELEGWCRRVDGTVFRGLVAQLSAAEDAGAPPVAAATQVFVVTDITSRYMREQALSRVRERIDEVTGSVAHLAFFSIDYLRGELEVWGAWSEVVGWSERTPPQRVGELLRLVHPDDRDAVAACFDRAVATGLAFEVELRVCSGSDRWVLLAGGVVDGQPPRIICAALDVTRQRELSDAVQATEATLQAVIAATHDGVATLDAGGAIQSLNEAACAMFRAPEARLIGRSWSELLDVGTEQLTESGTVDGALGRRSDGTNFTLECKIDVLGSGARRKTVIVMRDVTQRRMVERQVLDVSEQLQRQIGQDLHDGLGQLLTGTAFLAKGLQHGLALEHKLQAQRIVELINLAIARVRSLARGLSPIHVDAQNLEAVLRGTVSEASELLGVACDLEIVDFVDNAQPAAIAQLCLIAREAITNAVRHGHAQHIIVRLSRLGDQSVLSVEDDGVGIEEIDKPLEGLGLRSMRYRAKMIDGKLDIVRTRSGTTVTCCWRDG